MSDSDRVGGQAQIGEGNTTDSYLQCKRTQKLVEMTQADTKGEGEKRAPCLFVRERKRDDLKQ